MSRQFGRRATDEHKKEDPEPHLDPGDAAERRTLLLVLSINLLQVGLAGSVGFVADSTGLLGTALDSLSDAAVYVVSLFAVGRTVVAKSRAAGLAGVLLIVLALLLLVEVLRRFVAGSEPLGLAMIVIAVVNTGSNFVALRLLNPHRESGVHLNASWIFTANDMWANVGIVLSGLAILLFDSPLPDLVIGLAVVALVLHGGWEILSQARQAGQPEVSQVEIASMGTSERERRDG